LSELVVVRFVVSSNCPPDLPFPLGAICGRAAGTWSPAGQRRPAADGRKVSASQSPWPARPL